MIRLSQLLTEETSPAADRQTRTASSDVTSSGIDHYADMAGILMTSPAGCRSFEQARPFPAFNVAASFNSGWAAIVRLRRANSWKQTRTYRLVPGSDGELAQAER